MKIALIFSIPVSYRIPLFKILSTYEVCADSKWQLEYFKTLGIKTGVAIGGINLEMFKNNKRNAQNSSKKTFESRCR